MQFHQHVSGGSPGGGDGGEMMRAWALNNEAIERLKRGDAAGSQRLHREALAIKLCTRASRCPG